MPGGLWILPGWAGVGGRKGLFSHARPPKVSADLGDDKSKSWKKLDKILCERFWKHLSKT